MTAKVSNNTPATGTNSKDKPKQKKKFSKGKDKRVTIDQQVEVFEAMDNKESSNTQELQRSIQEFAASIGLKAPSSQSSTAESVGVKPHKKAAVIEPKDKSSKNISQQINQKPNQKNEQKNKIPNLARFEHKEASKASNSKHVAKAIAKNQESSQKSDKAPAPSARKAGTKIVFDDSGNKRNVTSLETSNPNTGQKARLLLDPAIMWYDVALPEIIPVDPENSANDAGALAKSEAYAMSLLENENSTFDRVKKHGKNAKMTSNDMDFVSSILKSGTLSDKISALTLLVQESPIHNITSINTLIGMTRKKHRREAIMAVSSLKDLLINNLLPDRKLVYYADRPWNASNITSRCYIVWIFEDFLKKAYFDLIKVIEELLFDTVEHTRISMLVHVEGLLEAKPEQEQNLLRLLVTKLGDKEKKVASKASFLTLQLLNMHPNMKTIVIKTVQELLLSRKKAGAERSQYYSMITLNQIILTSKDTEAANTLIDVYLNFFQTITQNNSEFGNKKDVDEKNLKKKPAKKGNFRNKAYYGRNAMNKSKDSANEENESELKSLENRMMAAILTGLNRSLPFSNLSVESWKVYSDVLFKVSHSANFNVVVQTLLFLLQLTQSGAIDNQRYYRTLYDSLLDPRIELSSKQGLYLNLVFKSLEADHNTNRIMAFVRRMLQISLYHSTPFVYGILYIISEIAASKPKIKSLWKATPTQFKSARITQQEADEDDSSTEKPKTFDSKFGTDYDPTKREPEYSNAQNSLCWEAITLIKHYHPTLSLQVLKLLNGDRTNKAANLHLHSLSHFLDRFVYRKPKKETVQRGTSIMQPNTNDDTAGFGSANIIGSNKLVWSRDSSLATTKNSKLINKKLMNNLAQLANINLEGINVSQEQEDSEPTVGGISNLVETATQRKTTQFIPKYLVVSANKISPENIFFQRFFNMKASAKNSRNKKKINENFDNMGDSDEGADLNTYSDDDDDDDDDDEVSSKLDRSYLEDDRTGFSSALMLAESGEKKRKGKKPRKLAGSDDFSDGLSEDEVWKAISADMPELNGVGDDDEDEDDIDFDENDYDNLDSEEDRDDTHLDDDDLDEPGSFDEDFSGDDDDNLMPTTGMNDEDEGGSSGGSDMSDDDLDLVFNENLPQNSKKRDLKPNPIKNSSSNKKQKREKRDRLPMIASFDDYAALIDG